METIPQFAEPLAGSIKAREETIHIRQTLTLYLQSQIKSEDGSHASHISTCTAHGVDSVNEVAPGLRDGLYAQYLRTLKANVAARKEYSEALQYLTEVKQEKQHSVAQDGSLSRGEDLQAYLSLLRARRKREKIRVLCHTFEKLNAMEPAKADYMISAGKLDMSAPLLQDEDSTALGNSTMPSDGELEDVMKDLERTVLLTKHRLGREGKKLNEVRSRMDSADASDVEVGMRLKALSRVRDELVQWVEEKLAAAPTDESILSRRDSGHDVAEEPPVSLGDKRSHLQDQYSAYISARRGLIDAVASASCEFPADEGSLGGTESGTKGSPGSLVDESTTDPTAILSYTCRNLLPLSKAQKTATIQKSHTSAMLAKEKLDASSIFGRLHEESHLLPEYPIHERQARSRHTMVGVNSRRSGRASTTSGPDNNLKVVEHAEAWAFASAAAEDTKREFVQDKVLAGTDMAKEGEDTLREVYGTMNRDYDEAAAGDTNGGQAPNEDVYAIETVRSRNRRSTLRGKRFDNQEKSPWSGLNGEVGVIGNE